MAQIRDLFYCSCNHTNKLEFKKPSLLTPTIVRFYCGGCKSEYMLAYEKKPGLKPGTFNMVPMSEDLSSSLKSILKTKRQVEEISHAK